MGGVIVQVIVESMFHVESAHVHTTSCCPHLEKIELQLKNRRTSVAIKQKQEAVIMENHAFVSIAFML